MIEAQIFLSYRRDLNNLSIQEARLRRQYEKDEAELQRRIAEREQAAKDRRVAEGKRWGKSHSALPDSPGVRHRLRSRRNWV
jgi:hypothetical protein